ncbi:glycerol-3-phosphate responsive antiterminator [Effusibacillus pohliae]|uniref:glycerol-3-phosphate responsive antiterminator n=1 Tax=Effusibacillus pohliae TaxID=232270 RepID=UPI0003631B7F|nr:glycerol-3-phosphate responsive antiterminator [Effusibacillus pohliae]
MNIDQFYERIINIKKIASVKESKYIEKALQAELSAVVLSIGNIAVIKRYVDLFKSNNLPVFLHIERLGGISHDREGIDFLAHYVKPTGIVSTRNSLIKQAKNQGLLTIQRVFLVDSDALKTGLQSVQETQPDAVELMPGLLTDILEEFKSEVDLPIIAGGLIRNKHQMIQALRYGAVAVSVGNYRLWKETLAGETN